MASIFGKKNRTSASASHAGPSPALVASVPYSQLASGPPPLAGPSASRLVSAPSTNPTLTDDGTPVRVSRTPTSSTQPPTTPRRRTEGSERERKGEGSRRSNASYLTDTGRSSSHEYQEMLRRTTPDTGHSTPIYEAMTSSKSCAFSPYSPSHPSPARPPGTPGTPSQEFGMRPHPYVAGRHNPETSSIRSMSSVNSTYDPNNPMSDTGRYPKFETQNIPGANGKSTTPTQSTMSLPLPLPFPLPNRSGEYARPPDHEIEFWYQQILQKTDLDPSRSYMSSPNPSLSRSSVSSLNSNSAARSAANLPMDSKWTIVQQYWKSREQQQKHHETPKALGKKTAAKGGKGSVEYFLSHALSRTLTPAILFSLEISLRTETLDWIQNFMDHQGQAALVNCLTPLIYTEGSCPPPTDIDEGLMHCLSRSIGKHRIGCADALSKPLMIEKIIPFLTCPNINCRLWAAQILTVLCQVTDPITGDKPGLQIVYSAFAHMQKKVNENVTDLKAKVGRFNLWLSQLAEVLARQGLMGTNVRAHALVKGLDVIEYCRTMVLLIVSLPTSNDRKTRSSIRNQLDLAVLPIIIQNLRQLHDPEINMQLDIYEENERNDRANMVDQERETLLKSLKTPEQIIPLLLERTKGSQSSRYLIDILRHFLLIDSDGDDEQARYFQLLDELISTIVMGSSPDLHYEFRDAFGKSIAHLFGKLVEHHRVDEAMAEVKELRLVNQRLQIEKQELDEEISAGNDGLVGKLKGQVMDLEQRLNRSRVAMEAAVDEKEGMRRDNEQRMRELRLYLQMLYSIILAAGIDIADALESLGFRNAAEEMENLLGELGGMERDEKMWGAEKRKARQFALDKLQNKKVLDGKTSSVDVQESDGGEGGEVEEEEEDEAAQVMEAEKIALGGKARGQRKSVKKKPHKVVIPRELKALSQSQFEDAEGEQEQLNVDNRVKEGYDSVSPIRAQFHQSKRRGAPPGLAPPVGEKSVFRSIKKPPPFAPRFVPELSSRPINRSTSAPAQLVDLDLPQLGQDEEEEGEEGEEIGGTSRMDKKRENLRAELLARGKGGKHGMSADEVRGRV
ncbi:hypothetical protein AYX15_03948 [Cryptococcus neoformans]|nr:hypothetical protein AYX15_03948 [Cryptococcus neoformans var. grubii]